MVSSIRSLRLILWIFVLLPTACIPKWGENSGPEHSTYYIDTPNGFAVEYPAEWSKTRKPPSSVVWQPPPGDAAAEIMAKITSFVPQDVPGGEDRMLNDFLAAHPGFVVSSREQMDVGGAPPALRVQGHTPDRIMLACFITTRQRAFVLEFSAPPQKFASYRSVFEEMANSFRVLE